MKQQGDESSLLSSLRRPVHRFERATCPHDLPLLRVDGVLQPGHGNEEQRREEVPEKEIDPGERKIKGAEPESGPQRAKNGGMLHGAFSFGLGKFLRGKYSCVASGTSPLLRPPSPEWTTENAWDAR